MIKHFFQQFAGKTGRGNEKWERKIFSFYGLMMVALDGGEVEIGQSLIYSFVKVINSNYVHQLKKSEREKLAQ